MPRRTRSTTVGKKKKEKKEKLPSKHEASCWGCEKDFNQKALKECTGRCARNGSEYCSSCWNKEPHQKGFGETRECGMCGTNPICVRCENCENDRPGCEACYTSGCRDCVFEMCCLGVMYCMKCQENWKKCKKCGEQKCQRCMNDCCGGVNLDPATFALRKAKRAERAKRAEEENAAEWRQQKMKLFYILAVVVLLASLFQTQANPWTQQV